MEEVNIDLETMKHTFISREQSGEFPVCEDALVGK